MAHEAHVAHVDGFATPETAPVGSSADRELEIVDFLHVRLMDGGERVVLAGELCYASVPYVDDRLRRFERCALPIRTLDLSELSFVDLPGLDLIDAWEARQRRHGSAAELVPGRRLTRLREVLEAGRAAQAREEARDLGRLHPATS